MKTRSPEKRILETSKKELIQGIIWIVITVIILLLTSIIIDVEVVRENAENIGFYGPFIFIIIKISTIVFAPLAGAPLYLIAGPLFGFYKGFGYVMIGDIIGNTIAFYISRIYGKKILNLFLQTKGKKKVERMLSYLGTFKGIIYARFIFFAFQDLISYAAGLTKIRYSTYIISSTIAVIIPIGLLVALGSAIVDKSTINLAIIIGLTIGIIVLIYKILMVLKAKTK